MRVNNLRSFFRLQFIDSSKFVLFLINEVLSQLDKIPTEMENFKFVHLELLKVYAECCAKCKSLPDDEEVVEKTINLLYVSRFLFLYIFMTITVTVEVRLK